MGRRRRPGEPVTIKRVTLPDGAEYDIRVDPSTGRFGAYDEHGCHFGAGDLGSLESRLNSAHRKASIKIDVNFVEAVTGDRWTIHGKHARTGAWLIKKSDGGHEQRSYWSFHDPESADFLRPLDPAERRKLMSLLAAMNKATEAWRRFSKQHAIDVRRALDTAWELAGGGRADE